MGRQVLSTDTRAVHAPLVMPDVQIEFWAGVYLANPAIAARGVAFERFLAHPGWYLFGARAIVTLRGRGLPERTRVALLEVPDPAVAALERAGAANANGRIIEKLRHHRHPRGARRDFVKAAS